ncbi:hypothetical protein ACIQF6_01570 [Kitasatospora sp. NPDC092948]|uniref:hypothetical protein n=1 Tax=Kitasatospora sp. NPDC092948 TaxID=3364088 RepID=UPI00382D06E6
MTNPPMVDIREATKKFDNGPPAPAGATLSVASGNSAVAGRQSARNRRRFPCRWPELALIGCGVAVLAWAFVLFVALPSTTTAAHWSAAWAGLDVMEALGFIATGVLAARGDLRRVLSAAATSVLLLVDSWFDLMTAGPGRDFAVALAMACFGELPLAVVCAVVAWRSLRVPTPTVDH